MWPAIIGAGAALAGGAMSYFGAKSANEMNQRMAREQMGFQERMSNTSWQRAVADMEAAGINPMVAFSQGGASSPGGAMSTSVNAMGQGVNSAVEARRMAAELQNMEAQNENLRAQGRKLDAETTNTEIKSMLDKELIPKARKSRAYDESKFGDLEQVLKRSPDLTKLLKMFLLRGAS